MQQDSFGKRVSTGVIGLDQILFGGLVENRGYLIRGGPGTGKTTLGMHFLSDGVKVGKKCLFITLGESKDSLIENAKRVGIDTSDIEFLDLSPNSDFFSKNESFSLFAAGEVERDPLTKSIIQAVQKYKPARVFLDSTSHLRYLAIDSTQFRKQLLSFIRFLLEQNSTVMFTSESSASNPDDDVMYLSDGVINLSLAHTNRKIEVTKFRGSDFRSGQHTLKLTSHGYDVYPILRPQEHERAFVAQAIGTGIDELDKLLGGGLERGTVTVLTGPAGAGKTTLGLQLIKHASEKGERCAVYSFEESMDLLVQRSENIGISVKEMIKSKDLEIYQIEPLLYTSDEIANHIRKKVETDGIRLVMLDSIAGYRLAVQDGDLLTNLRALMKYLSNMGVTVVATNEVETITGDFRATEAGISFMVDNIVFLRYLELNGEMKKAIGVLKKRLSDFERNLREFAITAQGIKLGQPLCNLRGILSGVPEWIGPQPDHLRD